MVKNEYYLPQQVNAYIKENQIEKTINDVVNETLLTLPKDPYGFMASKLLNLAKDIPTFDNIIFDSVTSKNIYHYYVHLNIRNCSTKAAKITLTWENFSQHQAFLNILQALGNYLKSSAITVLDWSFPESIEKFFKDHDSVNRLIVKKITDGFIESIETYLPLVNAAHKILQGVDSYSLENAADVATLFGVGRRLEMEGEKREMNFDALQKLMSFERDGRVNNLFYGDLPSLTNGINISWEKIKMAPSTFQVSNFPYLVYNLMTLGSHSSVSLALPLEVTFLMANVLANQKSQDKKKKDIKKQDSLEFLSPPTFAVSLSNANTLFNLIKNELIKSFTTNKTLQPLIQNNQITCPADFNQGMQLTITAICSVLQVEQDFLIKNVRSIFLSGGVSIICDVGDLETVSGKLNQFLTKDIISSIIIKNSAERDPFNKFTSNSPHIKIIAEPSINRHSNFRELFPHVQNKERSFVQFFDEMSEESEWISGCEFLLRFLILSLVKSEEKYILISPPCVSPGEVSVFDEKIKSILSRSMLLNA